MNSVISLENVSKKYRLGLGKTGLRESLSNYFRRLVHSQSSNEDRTLWALSNINLTVGSGESVGLIGPNGAGKTTILKIISKITEPTDGTLTVNGNVSALIELGAGFHPDLTGLENIELNGSILGMSRSEIRKSIDKIVEFSGLEKFIDTPVKRYSSGMYVRLGFSIAAHVSPKILLVDEVLAVGDAEFRQKCALKVAELKAEGTTIIFVSHNLWLVQSVCDRVLFLRHGKVRWDGDSVSAIKAYEEWLHTHRVQTIKQEDELDPSENNFIMIEKVEIKEVNGEDRQQFSHSDRIEINTSFRVKELIANPNLVLRIIRTDGTTCCMIRTNDTQFPISSMDGKGTISVVVDPLQLSSGAYSIEAKIMMGSIDGLPLAIGHSTWFHVKGPSLGHVDASGVFVPRVASVQLLRN